MESQKNISENSKLAIDFSQLQQTPELCKAVCKVMLAVNGVEKNSEVGSGRNSYKGVKDQDVKNAYKNAMAENGLCIMPVGIETKLHLAQWSEKGQYGSKVKVHALTEAWTYFLLMHESGEQQVICGYGHGIDSQDKSAGKATTYALKYALLYLFLTPTGQIDDTDNTHSEDLPTPPTVEEPKPTKTKQEPAETEKQPLYSLEMAKKHNDFYNNQFLAGATVDAMKTNLLKNYKVIGEGVQKYLEDLKKEIDKLQDDGKATNQ